jgi:hypothetical protein
LLDFLRCNIVAKAYEVMGVTRLHSVGDSSMSGREVEEQKYTKGYGASQKV